MDDMSLLISVIGVAIGAGVIGGVLAGLLGVGGGIVIVPALYFAFGALGIPAGMAMQIAVGTSLATIIFTALSSSWGHFKRGAVDFALLRKWAPWLLIGVIAGSHLGGAISGHVMMAVFAIVALGVGIDMMLRRSKTDTVREFSPPVWAGLGVISGGISALMGIGGGTVCVPILSLLGYDIRRAVGTSAAIGVIIGLPGAIVYAWSGLGQTGLPPFSVGYVNLLTAAVIVPLSTTFAQLGARLAHTIPPRALRLCFGVFLILTGARMGLDLLTA